MVKFINTKCNWSHVLPESKNSKKILNACRYAVHKVIENMLSTDNSALSLCNLHSTDELLLLLQDVYSCMDEMFKTYSMKRGGCIEDPVLLVCSCFKVALQTESAVDWINFDDVFSYKLIAKFFPIVFESKNINVIPFTSDKLYDMTIHLLEDNDWKGCSNKLRKTMNINNEERKKSSFRDISFDETLKLCKTNPGKNVNFENLVMEYIGDGIYECSISLV